MEIKISKRDTIHVLNWLNAFKHLCNDPHVGMHYLVNDIEEVRERLWNECAPNFKKSQVEKKQDGKKAPFGIMKSCLDQIAYGTGNDNWFMDKRYERV